MRCTCASLSGGMYACSDRNGRGLGQGEAPRGEARHLQTAASSSTNQPPGFSQPTQSHPGCHRQQRRPPLQVARWRRQEVAVAAGGTSGGAASRGNSASRLRFAGRSILSALNQAEALPFADMEGFRWCSLRCSLCTPTDEAGRDVCTQPRNEAKQAARGHSSRGTGQLAGKQVSGTRAAFHMAWPPPSYEGRGWAPSCSSERVHGSLRWRDR